MTTMQSASRQLSRSNAALALLLLLGNLVFFACVASRHLGSATDLTYPAVQTARITVIGV
jgi:hypothetical protein